MGGTRTVRNQLAAAITVNVGCATASGRYFNTVNLHTRLEKELCKVEARAMDA